MVRPLDENHLVELPMSGGALTVQFDDAEDLADQRDRFLGNGGLFVATDVQPKPFCEFRLTLKMPDGHDLAHLPARLVQIVPYGEPGLMLQLLSQPPDLLQRIDAWLAEAPAPDDGEIHDLDTLEPEEAEPEDAPEPEPEDPGEDTGALDMNVFAPGASRPQMLEHLRRLTPNQRQILAKRANRVLRSILMRDNEPSVIFFLLKNPQITKQEVVDISKMPTINHHSVTAMLANKQWAAGEDLRYNLVRNPKTPLPIALKLVQNLSMKHLREIAKDWGMKTRIKQAALRLVVQRGGQ